MKTAFLLAILLISAFALRVDLEARSNGITLEERVRSSVSNGYLTPVTETELLRTSNSAPLTTNLDNLVLSDHPSIDLENFQDLQYYGPGAVGSEGEVFEFVYDTGSSWIWVSAKGCDNCPGEARFDSATSSSFESTGVRKDLSYGKGFASGEISHDTVGIPGFEGATSKFIPADKSQDMEGTKASGIIGLTPVAQDADLLVSNLAEAGVIDGEEFTVYIGKDGFDGSWIDFGINADDQSEVTWIELTKLVGTNELIYWSANFDAFTIGDTKLDLQYTSTIWDTGTSLIGFGPSDHKKVIAGLADGKQVVKTQDGFYGVECSGSSDINSLDFDFNGHTINVHPLEFVIEQQGYCFFLIFEINLPGALLGDSFLRGTKIIHDQAGEKMGVFPQHKYFDAPADMIKEESF